MGGIKKIVKVFVCDSMGATAIEYALIAGLIAVVIIASVTGLGTNLSTYYEGIATAIGSVGS